jgi:hypothetical protein
MAKSIRKVIRSELEQRRALKEESRAHCARLLQLTESARPLSRKQIAARNGVPLGLVESIARGMG